MFRSYHLLPISKQESPISFEWNSKTGGVRGPSAALVIDMARKASRAGEVVGHPYPTPHIITDPLRTPSEMAVVLGNKWHLPPDLAAVYPEAEDEDTTDDGDDGTTNLRR